MQLFHFKKIYEEPKAKLPQGPMSSTEASARKEKFCKYGA
jgi:hypothetical protein